MQCSASYVYFNETYYHVACQSSHEQVREYARTAWSPCTLKDINSVESIQRRATRFVFNDYTVSLSSTVSSMLEDLN